MDVLAGAAALCGGVGVAYGAQRDAGIRLGDGEEVFETEGCAEILGR